MQPCIAKVANVRPITAFYEVLNVWLVFFYGGVVQLAFDLGDTERLL